MQFSDVQGAREPLAVAGSISGAFGAGTHSGELADLSTSVVLSPCCPCPTPSFGGGGLLYLLSSWG